MSQRRMFSPDIVDSDDFLDMPSSSQLLYFHLSMRADDDGFVSPKKVMRLVNASNDDLKVLLAKRFLLTFDNGVVVIKHWLIHNLIRKDRYKQTRYLDQKNMLKIKENGSYTEMTTNGLPNGNQMAPQVRLGKVRLGNKTSIAATPQKEFSFEEQIKKMVASTDPRMWIIALYWSLKEIQLSSYDQYTKSLRRELRPAGELKPYEKDRLKETMIWLKENADFKWTLETVAKYINEKLEIIPKKKGSFTLITK